MYLVVAMVVRWLLGYNPFLLMEGLFEPHSLGVNAIKIPLIFLGESIRISK